jgi:hypothetical protein
MDEVPIVVGFVLQHIKGFCQLGLSMRDSRAVSVEDGEALPMSCSSSCHERGELAHVFGRHSSVAQLRQHHDQGRLSLTETPATIWSASDPR